MAVVADRYIILDPDADPLPVIIDLRLPLRNLQPLTDIKAGFNGEHHARLVKIHYAGGIGPASVDATNYYFLVPGLGPVAYSDDRSISAFIFYNNDSDRSGVLKEVRKSTGR